MVIFASVLEVKNIKRNNTIFIFIIAIALLMLCLSSVSAIDEDNINNNLTVNDNMENEKIEINDADDISSDGDIAGVEKDNLLKVSDKDLLGGTTTYLSLSEIEKTDETVNVRVEWTTDNNMFYNYYPYTKNVVFYKNNDVNDVLATLNSLTYATNSNTGNVYYYGETTISLSDSGWFNITANVESSYSGSPTYDSATSNTLSYYVGTPTAATTTTLNIVKDENDYTKVTITPTVQKTEDSSAITTADSVEIYINGEKYGSNIAADGNVVYTNSEENTYSVYAHYIGDEDYSESYSQVQSRK